MRLYNSLTQQKEKFVPLNDKQVLMYVCGITPYDTTHLGHAFTYVFFDALVRYLQHKGYEINYTQNVTDIDDDILKKAGEVKQNWKKLGDYWTDRFLRDLHELNIHPPTHYVKATESINSMVRIIELLIQRGFAYERNGNVYFNIKKFPHYGKLSRFNEYQMLIISKERGADPQDPNKKNPLDFLLWQQSKFDEPSWKSPWGHGRPGWHIECSAMINKYLGTQIDIHGGGRDLIFPHHESEVAQSESHGEKTPFAKYWVHTAMLMYQGEKMSKSLGNLVMVSDLFKTYSSDAIRWVLLSHYYRLPWEFKYDELDSAQITINNLQRAIKNIKKDENAEVDQEYFSKFEYAMDDDLNIPKALEIILEIFDKNKLQKNYILQSTFFKMLRTLGFKFE